MSELEMIIKQKAGLLDWNFAEINSQVDEITKRYSNLVFTEAELPEAKKEKASLNKLAKSINDKKVSAKKEFMKPYDAFEKQVKEVIGKINDASANIDMQVKGFEEKQKAEKKELIRQYFESTNNIEGIELSSIWEEQWLNKTFTIKNVYTAIDSKLDNIRNNIQMFTAMADEEQKAFCLDAYMDFLDVGRALDMWNSYKAQQERMAQLKKEAEAKKEEPATVEPAEEIKAEAPEVFTRVMKVTGTREQLWKLADFMDANGIKYERG